MTLTLRLTSLFCLFSLLATAQPTATYPQLKGTIDANIKGGSASDRITAAKLNATLTAMAQKLFFVAETRSALNVRDYGAVPNDGLDDKAAIQACYTAATATLPHKSVYYPNGQYDVQSTPILSNGNRMKILADGAIIVPRGGATGTRIEGGSQVTVQGLVFQGDGIRQDIGIDVFNSENYKVVSCTFIALKVGIYSNLPASSSVPPTGGGIGENNIDDCGIGVQLLQFAEYVNINLNYIRRCSQFGIYTQAGNTSIALNTVVENAIGVAVYGTDGATGTNSDHGAVRDNIINHNSYVGLLVANTSNAEQVTGNTIWANIGPNLTESPWSTYDTDFGVFLLNVEHINMVGNSIARNRCNMGADGWVLSSVTANTFIADPARTRHQFKEYGASQSTYNLNAQNTFGFNQWSGAMLNGKTEYIDLLKSQLTQTVEITGNADLYSSRFKVLSSTISGTFFHNGIYKYLTVNSDYTGGVTLLAALKQQEFSIVYQQVSGSTNSYTLTLGGSVNAQSLTSAATVSGAAIVLTQTGKYTFTPSGVDSFFITRSL